MSEKWMATGPASQANRNRRTRRKAANPPRTANPAVNALGVGIGSTTTSAGRLRGRRSILGDNSPIELADRSQTGSSIRPAADGFPSLDEIKTGKSAAATTGAAPSGGGVITPPSATVPRRPETISESIIREVRIIRPF